MGGILTPRSHGDFVNGWDVDVLQLAVDQCTNDSGCGRVAPARDRSAYTSPYSVIEDCGLLQLRTDDEMGDCAMAARVSDDINGCASRWRTELPRLRPDSQGSSACPGATT